MFRRADGRLLDHPVAEGIESVGTFLGSAFRVEGGHVPLLRLSTTAVARPVQSTQPHPEEEDIGGWLQGALVEAGQGRVGIFAEAALFTAQVRGQLVMGMNAPEGRGSAATAPDGSVGGFRPCSAHGLRDARINRTELPVHVVEELAETVALQLPPERKVDIARQPSRPAAPRASETSSSSSVRETFCMTMPLSCLPVGVHRQHANLLNLVGKPFPASFVRGKARDERRRFAEEVPCLAPFSRRSGDFFTSSTARRREPSPPTTSRLPR